MRSMLFVAIGLAALMLSAGSAAAKKTKVHLLPTHLTCEDLLDGADLGSSTITTTSQSGNPCVYLYESSAPYPYPTPPLVSGGTMICYAKADWSGANLLHKTLDVNPGHPTRPLFKFSNIGTRAEIFVLDDDDQPEAIGEVQVDNAFCQLRISGRGPGYVQDGSYVADSGGTIPSGVETVPAAVSLQLVAVTKHALTVIASELR